MSYTPGFGAIQHAVLFSFSHTSGTAGTGALGFTPKFAIYVGAIQTSGTEVSIASGFATGTAGNARANGFGFNVGPGAPQLPGGTAAIDSSAIGGRAQAIQNNASFSAFNQTLDVSAFSAAGIDLTWTASVTTHSGHLLVIG